MLSKIQAIYKLHQNFDYSSFYKSIKSIIINIWKKQEYDIVFVTHNHFNRGEKGENMFLLPFYDACKKNHVSYKIIEETSLKGSFSMYPREDHADYFDFILLIQFILRKLFSKKNNNYNNYINYYSREVKVSKIIKSLFLKNFQAKIYIVLAHSNVELWRIVNPNALIMDYQHGMIWNGYDNILLNSKAAKIKVLNNIITLVFGDAFKKLLVKNDKTKFYNEQNVISIGYYLPVLSFKARKNHKVILYTLQNVDLKSNTEYYEVIKRLIMYNKDFFEKNEYKILIKNHPRYNRQDKLFFDQNLSFISFLNDNKQIEELSKNISLHITSKSTTTFDLALKGIPTIFIDMIAIRSPRDMFINQYKYPFEHFIVSEYHMLESVLNELENEENYYNASQQVYTWSREFYQDFNTKRIFQLLEDISIKVTSER